jgi:glycosyltransferase involved in cell wall biosynthesis
MQKKISVVIPTYSRPELLVSCLRALAAQTIDKGLFEVIVVSDGPDPETVRALRPWLRQNIFELNYLSTPVKKGPAAARNLGWLSARSALIAFTDDDCLPDRRWLETFADHYSGQALCAYSGHTSVPLPAEPTDFDLNTAGLEQAEFITANCACTKEALFRTGGFDERFKLAWREDSDLHFKLLTHCIPVIKVPEAKVTHPVRAVRWGVSIREQKKASYEALLFSKYPDLYKTRIAGKSLWNYYLINLLWLVLIGSLIFREYKVAEFSAIMLVALWLMFAVERLRNTRKSMKHVLEMLATSVIIPTLSVYWRLYGAVKYRVIFI